MALLLASGSPRRRALLQEAGIDFRVVGVRPEVEEAAPAEGDPHAVALENACRKAVAAEARSGEVVLGADTVVALGRRLLGKPRDDEDARAILASLSGTTHRVVTGIALRSGERVVTNSVETRVTMRPLSAEEIAAYVATGESMGKAGAYAIQERGDRFVTRIEGPWDNVVGLPVAAVRALLRQFDVD